MILLKAKLQIPPVALGSIIRDDLLDRLTAGLDKAVTLVSAPSGFGKTSLVSSWAECCGLPVAWYSVDYEDNDVIRFLHYLIAGIQKIMPNVGESALAVLKCGTKEVQNALVTLLNDISTMPPLTDDGFKHVLVLDDFHTVSDNADITGAVSFLAHYLPRQLHLVIISRVDPKIYLHKLRIQRKLNEIRSEDLRLNLEEARRIYSAIRGTKVSGVDIEELLELSGGWVVGFLLNCSFADSKPAPHRPENVEEILRYLDEEVFASLPPDVQTFMQRTGLLGNFTAPLCDAVTGRSDSRKLLRWLEKQGLFVMALDDNRDVYRYRAFFQELLQNHQHDPVERVSVFSLASRWYENSDDVFSAIKCAFEAGEYDRANQLFTDHRFEHMVFAGHALSVSKLLATVPEAKLMCYPKLSLVFAWCHLVEGKTHEIEKYVLYAMSSLGIHTIEQQIWPTGGSSETEQMLGELAAIICVQANTQRKSEHAIELAQYALKRIPGHLYYLRSGVLGILGDAYQLCGQYDLAVDTYGEAIELSKHGENFVSTAQLHTDMGITLSHVGRFRKAERCYRRAINLCQHLNAPIYPIALAHLELGRTYIEWNRFDSAEESIVKSIAVARLGGYKRTLIRSYLMLSKLRILQRRPDEAEALLRAAVAADGRDGRLAPSFTAVRVELALSKGEVEQARDLCRAVKSDERQSDYLCFVHYRLAEGGTLDDVIELLGQLRRREGNSELLRHRAEIELLLAVALLRSGDRHQAQAALESAMELAMVEEYIALVSRYTCELRPLLVQMQGERGRFSGFAERILDTNTSESDRGVTGGAIVTLTEREKSVLRLVRAGLRNREIGEELFISFSTVKTHIYNIYMKLGVTSRVQAVMVAENLNLI